MFAFPSCVFTCPAFPRFVGTNFLPWFLKLAGSVFAPELTNFPQSGKLHDSNNFIKQVSAGSLGLCIFI